MKKHKYHKCMVIVIAYLVVFFGYLPAFDSISAQTAIPMQSHKTDPAIKKQALDAMQKMTLPFIENRGQLDQQVAYYIKAQGGDIYLTQTGELVFAFIRTVATDADVNGHDETSIEARMDLRQRRTKHQRVVFKIVPQKTAADAKEIKVYGRKPTHAKVNYFKGKKEDWIGAIPTYQEVVYDGLFKNARVIYRAGAGMIEDVYELAAGAEPSQIRFKVEGAESLRTDDDGALKIMTIAGEFTIKPPLAFQTIGGRQVKAPCRFEVDGLRFGYKVENYDKLYALVIDPQFMYGTFLGGAGGGYGNDSAADVVVDANGRAYIVGSTWAYNFPVTTGAYDTEHNGHQDAYLAVLNPHGFGGNADMIYAAYLGGSLYDSGNGVAVYNGHAYIVGSCEFDFPTTPGAYTENCSDIDRGFFCVIDPAGNGVSDLIYSTYLHCKSSACGIAVASGNAYIVGSIYADTLITTQGAYDDSFNGSSSYGFSDAFLSVISPSGNGAADMIYSTYLGASRSDNAKDVAVASGKVYVLGGTKSPDFPVTAGAYDTSYHNYVDIFLSVFDPSGNGADDLIYSTFIGSDAYDAGYDIAVSSDQVYIVGSTSSSEFDTTEGAYDTIHNGGSDAFLCVINPQSSGDNDLIYSTFWGGDANDSGNGVAIANGKVYIIGETSSSGFPTTANAYSTSKNGNNDAFLCLIDPAGNGADDLLYSTFLGGGDNDSGHGMAINNESVYLVGTTSSYGFPTTTGAYDRTLNEGADAFLSVLNPKGNGANDLIYSTFIGGNGSDNGYSVTTESGKTYITGYTCSFGFPATTNSYDVSYNRNKDAFLAIVNTSLSGAGSLIYSTYFGGSEDDSAYDVAVSSGLAYFAGQTSSDDFPTTVGAYNENLNYTKDAFLSIINPAGKGTDDLIYSTYIGGVDWDKANSVAVSGNQVFVAGNTQSNDFPATPGAYDSSYNGQDAFLSIFEPSGHNDDDLIYSTYIGGRYLDEAHSLAVSDGKAYIVGHTRSDDFPATAGAYDNDFSDDYEGFLSVIDPQGNNTADLLYSTSLGGSDWDKAHGVAVSDGRVYIVGGTGSSDFPTTPGAYDTWGYSYSFIHCDAYLSVIEPSGNGADDLLYSTYLSGSHLDEAYDVAVYNGQAYIVGFTESADFPVTEDAYDGSHNNGKDAFLSIINPLGGGLSDLRYSTFLGGERSDVAHSMAFSDNHACIVGTTSSNDFPTTPDAYNTTLNGEDVFLAVFNLDAQSAGTLKLDDLAYIIGEDGMNLEVSVSRTGDSGGAVRVRYATSNGTAIAGKDYISANGVLNWADGDNAFKTINIPILSDSLFEGDEFFHLTLTDANGAVLGEPQEAIIIITENEAGILKFSEDNYAVQENIGDFTIHVNRFGGSTGDVSVHYSTSSGSAMSGSDYTDVSGTLNWADGDTAPKAITIPIIDDTVMESSETFYILIDGITGGVQLVDNTASVTIFDFEDSDGDGLSDNDEDIFHTDPFDADTDDDGLPDEAEIMIYPIDPALPFLSNPLKSDADKDGVQDGTESGKTLNDIGADTDTGVFIPDQDPATTTHPLNPDTDGDGLADGEEDQNFNGRVDAGETDPNHASDRPVYDTFGRPHIKEYRWNTGYNDWQSLHGEIVSEIVDGKFVFKIGGATGPEGDLLNTIPIDHQNTHTVEARVAVNKVELDNTDTYKAGARIGGYFYEHDGKLWAAVYIGDRGQGVEAWWEVESIDTNSGTTRIIGASGVIPAAIQTKIEYPVKIKYDEITDTLTFTVAGVSHTYNAPTHSGTASPFSLHLTTGVWGDSDKGSGYVSATFDDVRINNETDLYDDFEAPLINPDKWNQYNLEIVREVRDGKLHLYRRVQQQELSSGTGSRLFMLTDNATDYLEALVEVRSDSQVSAGATGVAIMGGYFWDYVWTDIRLVLDETHSLKATIVIEDYQNNTPVTLFNHTFSTSVAFDTQYRFSIERQGAKMILRCNDERVTYAIETPFNPPPENLRGLITYLYTDIGESGYMQATFDNVYTVVEKGDLNGDYTVDLADAILAAQVITGQSPSQLRANYVLSGTDVNGDNKVGMEESIYILQAAAELR